MITPRERVKLAIKHQVPDRIPRDFSAEPAIWSNLMRQLNTDSREDVLRFFEIDCRVLSYDTQWFCKPPHVESRSGPQMWKRETNSNSYVDVWGAKRSRVCNDWGEYEELCEYPLAAAENCNDLKNHPWPTPDWWDFTDIADVVDAIGQNGHYHLRFRVGSIFETAWSLRGFERFLMDLAMNPDIARYIMERILEIHLENLRRVMQRTADKIDMIYTYDDLGHQHGLLLSPAMWRKIIRPLQVKLFDKAKEYAKPVMLHSCGAIKPLLNELIDIGLDVIDPVQPLAAGMDISELKKEFGERLTFHGGIDIQKLLPCGMPTDVTETARQTCCILGKQGGYIFAPAHHIQADTPLENVFAMYEGAS